MTSDEPTPPLLTTDPPSTQHPPPLDEPTGGLADEREAADGGGAHSTRLGEPDKQVHARSRVKLAVIIGTAAVLVLGLGVGITLVVTRQSVDPAAAKACTMLSGAVNDERSALWDWNTGGKTKTQSDNVNFYKGQRTREIQEAARTAPNLLAATFDAALQSSQMMDQLWALQLAGNADDETQRQANIAWFFALDSAYDDCTKAGVTVQDFNMDKGVPEDHTLGTS